MSAVASPSAPPNSEASASAATGTQQQTGVLRKMKYVWNNNRSVRIVGSLMATYMGHMTLNGITMAARNPVDFSENPKAALRGLFMFAPRADMMEVQHAHKVLLDTYGQYTESPGCGYPIIEFRNNINGGSVGRYIPPTYETPPVIQLSTYQPNLALTAAHEYLHCYTQNSFVEALTDAVGWKEEAAIREGVTEMLSRKLKLPRPDPAELQQTKFYSKEVKFAEKIMNDIGEDTLKKAYLSGDSDAISSFVESVKKHLAT